MSSLPGYEHFIGASPKVYIGKVTGSVWSPVPLDSAANYANLDEVRAHCDQNIYCSGVINQHGQALCFSTEYITHAMKQEYPDMGNNAQSGYTHTFVRVRWPRFELKAANIEAIHSVQAQRTSIRHKVETILEQLKTCYSCSQSHYISQSYTIDSRGHTLSESGNYNEHILNKTEGYPFKDDNNNAVCIDDQQQHERWVFSIENPKCPNGTWVPTKQVTLSDTYVYESNGRWLTQQTMTVPEHCEQDKWERDCADNTMEIRPAVFDD